MAKHVPVLLRSFATAVSINFGDIFGIFRHIRIDSNLHIFHLNEMAHEIRVSFFFVSVSLPKREYGACWTLNVGRNLVCIRMANTANGRANVMRSCQIQNDIVWQANAASFISNVQSQHMRRNSLAEHSEHSHKIMANWTQIRSFDHFEFSMINKYRFCFSHFTLNRINSGFIATRNGSLTQMTSIRSLRCTRTSELVSIDAIAFGARK